MVASLVRLLHSGPQDQRLLPIKPNDTSAYVRVLVRAGRMTTQWHRLDFQQKPQFGQQAFCELPTKGELLTRLYLVTTMPDIYTPQLEAQTAAGANFAGPRFGWTNSLGHALIDQATVDIGGSRVERLDSRLLEIMDEYNTPLEKLVNKNTLIARKDNGFRETTFGNSLTPQQVVVPLPFWFSKGDLGAALPIDAIHVDSVRVGIQFRPLNQVVYTQSRNFVNGLSAAVPNVIGSALWPIEGSSFYQLDAGGAVVPGLVETDGTPITAPVSVIPGIKMPRSFSLGDTYLLAEYIYLDRPEANRFRLADIEIPITQHYTIEPKDTKGFQNCIIPFELINPVRSLYWMGQNYNALQYNTYFLATKDLASQVTYPTSEYPERYSETYIPWWPDCSGLFAGVPGFLIPGFSTRGSEPFTSIEVVYEGSFIRTSTENCALYRSILPSLEERKSPWVNRYMYCIPFGTQAGFYPPSTPMGEANWNRIMKKEMRLGVAPTGQSPQRLWVYCYAETYNILKVYGGRASLLFAY